MSANYIFLRLCRRKSIQNKILTFVRYLSYDTDVQKTIETKSINSLIEKYKDKISFSSYLNSLKSVEYAAKKGILNEINSKENLLSGESLHYYAKGTLLTEFESVNTQGENIINNQISMGAVDRSSTHNFELEKQHKQTNYEGNTSAAESQMQCEMCGVLLHSSNPAVPGYLPKDILQRFQNVEQQGKECQQCQSQKTGNSAANANITHEEYHEMLHSIKHMKSLVLLMVDLLDLPGSMWRGLVDIVGTEQPLIIVANKMDLLPGKSTAYLSRIKQCITTEMNKTLLSTANVKHVAIISASTGYGVDDLLSTMSNLWSNNSEVFVIGCANVGKSTFFNMLLQSDYCTMRYGQRSHISSISETNLNLRKFPISMPTSSSKYGLNKRVKMMKLEKEIKKARLQGKMSQLTPSLVGHIGKTVSGPTDLNDLFDFGRSYVDKDTTEKWFYDTPGLVHRDQLTSVLTAEELVQVTPRGALKPQIFHLDEGSTVFIGGVARLDLMTEGPCRFTIFCADSLPITITRTGDAAEIYDTFLGTDLLQIPKGGDRSVTWHKLKRTEFNFTGEGPKLCCGDIVLSSVGWVSINAKQEEVCRVAAWTPGGRGVHTRCPPLLPYAVNMQR